LFFICGLVFHFTFKMRRPLPQASSVVSVPFPAYQPGRSISDTIRFLANYWFILLPIVVIAFTETSFLSNFELIGLTVGSAPISLIFFAGALKGVLTVGFAHTYHVYFSGRTASNFVILSAITTTCSLSFLFMFAHQWISAGADTLVLQQILLLAAVAGFLASGSWWGIFSLSLVRRVSEPGRYAETAAYFKLPRAVITFAGITLLGISVDSHWFAPLMLLNGLLVAVTFVITYRRICQEAYERL
jgi:hypothetical protein